MVGKCPGSPCSKLKSLVCLWMAIKKVPLHPKNRLSGFEEKDKGLAELSASLEAQRHSAEKQW